MVLPVRREGDPGCERRRSSPAAGGWNRIGSVGGLAAGGKQKALPGAVCTSGWAWASERNALRTRSELDAHTLPHLLVKRKQLGPPRGKAPDRRTPPRLSGFQPLPLWGKGTCSTCVAGLCRRPAVGGEETDVPIIYRDDGSAAWGPIAAILVVAIAAVVFGFVMWGQARPVEPSSSNTTIIQRPAPAQPSSPVVVPIPMPGTPGPAGAPGPAGPAGAPGPAAPAEPAPAAPGQ